MVELGDFVTSEGLGELNEREDLDDFVNLPSLLNKLDLLAFEDLVDLLL